MISGCELNSAQLQPPATGFALPKLVNLVDFSECDVPESPHPGPDLSHSAQPREEALRREIQYLRQMLADFHKERTIQIDMLRDELAAKQRSIDALAQQGVQTETLLLSAHRELEALRSTQERQQLLGGQPAETDFRQAWPAQGQREWDFQDDLQEAVAQCCVLGAEIAFGAEPLACRRKQREVEIGWPELPRRSIARHQGELQTRRLRLVHREAVERAVEEAFSGAAGAAADTWERNFWEASQRWLTRGKRPSNRGIPLGPSDH